MNKLVCKHNENIWLTFNDDQEYDTDESESVVDFVGLALHAVQQGAAEQLYIHNFKIHAILMDQTTGEADMEDIYQVELGNTPIRCIYQRLRNIIYHDFQN